MEGEGVEGGESVGVFERVAGGREAREGMDRAGLDAGWEGHFVRGSDVAVVYIRLPALGVGAFYYVYKMYGSGVAHNPPSNCLPKELTLSLNLLKVVFEIHIPGISIVVKSKTYNSGYSLVVTDPTTNPPI